MSIALNKNNAPVGGTATLDDVKHLRVGVSWDPSTRGRGGLLGKLSRKGGVDLDLFAVLSTGREPKRLVSGFSPELLNPLHGRDGDGSITHSGDNTTGHGEGDDEVIDAHLAAIPMRYDSIVFAVANFKAHGMSAAMQDKGFQGADNVLFTGYNVIDGRPQSEWEIEPSLLATENCCLLVKVTRTSSTDPYAPWRIEVLEDFRRITAGDKMSLLRATQNVL